MVSNLLSLIFSNLKKGNGSLQTATLLGILGYLVLSSLGSSRVDAISVQENLVEHVRQCDITHAALARFLEGIDTKVDLLLSR